MRSTKTRLDFNIFIKTSQKIKIDEANDSLEADFFEKKVNKIDFRFSIQSNAFLIFALL